MNLDKFTITSFDQLTGFDRTTGNLDMVLDELTDFTLSQEEEKVSITGKGGRTIGSLKKNKNLLICLIRWLILHILDYQNILISIHQKYKFWHL